MKSKDLFYVSLQFVLFIGYTLAPQFGLFQFMDWVLNLGLVIAIIGSLILLLALVQLNRNLSPFPTPKFGSKLITTGLYQWIRHPIYTGILLFVFGFSVYSQNEFRLLIAFALLSLFYFKSAYEEKMLCQKFDNYKDYQKISGRFLPNF
jgi:protein-S-isoprenylcysteine O-methyltransferase Ste14